MKRRSANGLRVPKNGFQRAQEPAIWRPKRLPRPPKWHPESAHKQTPRDPCFRGPKGGLPKTLLRWGLAPNPHTPLVQISKAGPGRKLEEAFVTSHSESGLCRRTFSNPASESQGQAQPQFVVPKAHIIDCSGSHCILKIPARLCGKQLPFPMKSSPRNPNYLGSGLWGEQPDGQ